MKQAIKNFLNDETGATAIEYGLIAGLIAAALVTVITTLGDNISDLFTDIAAKMPTATK